MQWNYLVLRRLKDAEDCLSLACKRLSLCLGPHHATVNLTKSKLGELFLQSDQKDEAVELLKDVVETFGMPHV